MMKNNRDGSRRALLIAFYFPPIGGAGVQRPLKFAKYLPEFGWDVSVLTVDADKSSVRDESFARDIDERLTIDRAPMVGASFPYSLFVKAGLKTLPSLIDQWLFVPDNKIGWLIFALERAATIVESRKIDIIWTTSPPFSSHLIGWMVKKMTGVKWVADFRTEWSTGPYRHFPTPLHRLLHRSMERMVVNSADAVVTLSPPHTDIYREADRHCRSKYHTIENGYDEEDMSGPVAEKPPKFRIMYTGATYQYQNPWTFLDAVGEIVRRRLIPDDRWEIVFVGNLWEARERILAAAPNIRIEPYLPHKDICRYQRQSHLLFFELGAPLTRHLPGKIYEYMRSGTPVLAIAPVESIAAERIKRSQTGSVVPPGDVAAVRDAIVDYYKAWEMGESPHSPEMSEIAQFERRHLTGMLARIFDKLCLGKAVV